jgi:GDP-L-fucose synthase
VPPIEKHLRVFVAGHRGLVGSAIVRALESDGYTKLLLRTRDELDLRNGESVRRFFREQRPDYVFLAAAKVGGIAANNTYPADFILENVSIEMNVIQAAHETGVDRMLFLGSSCIYPKLAAQPLKESSLLTGPLEPTNRPYAVAKIAGIEMCWGLNRQFGTHYLAAMPTNLYGPNDNYDLATSHVLPALVKKFAKAVEENASAVEVWGSGTPRREFLHSDDLARACLLLMNLADVELERLTGSDTEPPLVNIGFGSDVTIAELAELIAEVSGFRGMIVFDPTKPDGTPRKLLDSSRMRALGWTARVSLRDGISAILRALPGSAEASTASRAF